jgi:hypothetical protein
VRDLPIADLMGETMRNAGMAITITSLTNFIVFAIGATTVNQLKGQCNEMNNLFKVLKIKSVLSVLYMRRLILIFFAKYSLF